MSESISLPLQFYFLVRFCFFFFFKFFWVYLPIIMDENDYPRFVNESTKND